MEGNVELGNKLERWAYVISIAVLALVGVMRRTKLDVGMDFSFLPPFHAIFNTIVAIALVFALVFAKRGAIKKHAMSINIAMLFSFLFLLSYVTYHFTTDETTYCDAGLVPSGVYFFFLITHIILAGVSLPFILLTFIRGYTGQVTRHRKMAKYVWPVWFYVAVTGPICYLMLQPCY